MLSISGVLTKICSHGEGDSYLYNSNMIHLLVVLQSPSLVEFSLFLATCSPIWPKSAYNCSTKLHCLCKYRKRAEENMANGDLLFLNQFKSPFRSFSGFHNWFMYVSDSTHNNNIRLSKNSNQSLVHTAPGQGHTSWVLECDCPSTNSTRTKSLRTEPEPHSNPGQNLFMNRRQATWQLFLP